ncbi:lactosylceramide 1,3-N-acetyl-beta-D-glucosaminyltransferase [Microcaecilia unicolor]|uniref:Hexosyltransferase n=1 Tax=Microcaecilia unicolor TaxID=1415580 RepID=A0A6P7YY87_9AMPH|nr:lactosylceramide 1,3-N-acetyl-beta-D-glucosaminyltransferase [Microcaecilia unicolor]XP_030072099.1 lactosylceramide 1,3-N-acetyl-beta-D-glucosaminyltransferase [Microcaecilia unicolor]XP_030072100.1 lactosylceramide 1,3-N-acetyl-beta-D-glucosaminyltransferase [Microcaecilia unicolor]XP_030072101.1 lactosylceramide 1,3-N-acetyl-beta-D-glucosaminyltransferase [Microcaecilia unicolor]XP_030072102.1 lactosylceramide 1,3-N-acetyl-beta-D-glucosaminyltransferase [Microcaecilia unicolor]XP_0300721
MVFGVRRIRKWQFMQIFASCFILSVMLLWGQQDTQIVSHVKSYSYRFLINNYSFVNNSLSISRNKIYGMPQYKYLINHKERCQAQDVLLLLFVKSSPESRHRRDAIRQTWGNEKYIFSEYDANIKIVFALGVQKDPVKRQILQAELKWEDQKYNDLIQQDFLDTFHNLTLKLVLQFEWANTYCPHAKFIMSADDDIFIHTPNLVSYLQSLEKTNVKDLWIGRVHRGSPPNRNRNSKYYVPYQMYQWSSYPDYTSGAAYVVSSDVAARVYEASQTLNTSFYIDDVFMGLCANKIGIMPQHHLFFSGEGKAPYHPCIYSKMMTSHGHVEDLHHLWQEATNHKINSLSAGFWGGIYCRLVNIILLCPLRFVDTYSCSAAWS